jgi:transposase
VLDVHDLIARLRLGQTLRAIARDLEIDRKTVREYRQLARAHGWLIGALPDVATVAALLKERTTRRAEQGSSVEPFRSLVVAWRAQRLEGVAIHRLLQERGFKGAYSAVRRFLRKMSDVTPDSCVRIEVAPGQEAQVDFGYAGEIFDPVRGKQCRAWAFVMVLSHSRHQYVELVFNQDVATWLKLHRRAFEFFGGVPRAIVLDNLKAGIIRACKYDPEVQRSYRDFASAYGFLIHPCAPRTPQHKGKVEKGGVHYVKRNCLAGRKFAGLRDANEHALQWVRETAGLRVHGTTRRQPLHTFEEIEKPALNPLPAHPYEITTWKRALLHRDVHVVFNGSYYSAPHRLIGKELWVSGTTDLVKIYEDYELVAQHIAASTPGTRRTDAAHIPAEQRAYAEQSADWCRSTAADIGSWAYALVEKLLSERPSDRLPTVQGIIKLRRKYSNKRLDLACRRALFFGELKYRTVRTILEKGMDGELLPGMEPAPANTSRPRFARDGRELFPGPGEGEEKCRQPLN